MNLNQVPNQDAGVLEHTRSTATVYIATTSLGFNLFFYKTRDLNYVSEVMQDNLLAFLMLTFAYLSLTHL